MSSRERPGMTHSAGMQEPIALQARRWPLVALGDFLFTQTGGQPLYLLETLKLLRDRQWLVPQSVPMEHWRLEPAVRWPPALAGAIPARTVAALGAGDDPVAPGEARASGTPAGAGQCRAGNSGEREVAVAAGRAGGAGRHRGPGGGGQEWDPARGGSQGGPPRQLSLLA